MQSLDITPEKAIELLSVADNVLKNINDKLFEVNQLIEAKQQLDNKTLIILHPVTGELIQCVGNMHKLCAGIVATISLVMDQKILEFTFKILSQISDVQRKHNHVSAHIFPFGVITLPAPDPPQQPPLSQPIVTPQIIIPPPTIIPVPVYQNIPPAASSTSDSPAAPQIPTQKSSWTTKMQKEDDEDLFFTDDEDNDVHRKYTSETGKSTSRANVRRQSERRGSQTPLERFLVSNYNDLASEEGLETNEAFRRAAVSGMVPEPFKNITSFGKALSTYCTSVRKGSGTAGSRRYSVFSFKNEETRLYFFNLLHSTS